MADQGSGVLEEVSKLLSVSGLLVMGRFHPVATDGVPVVSSNERTKTVLLIGNAGPDMWRAFRGSDFFNNRKKNNTIDALDHWTVSSISEIAERVSAQAIYPFDGPPHHPFQKWSRRSNAVTGSPLGLNIHSAYGLWHAYRAALLFPIEIQIMPEPKTKNPCDACRDRPCMSACPVHAFSDKGYDAAKCAGHLQSGSNIECMETGCLARQACPVGAQYIYQPEQASFHMDAFIRLVNSRA